MTGGSGMRNKWWIALSGLVAGIAFWWCVQLVPPRLVLEPETVDLGDVCAGEVLSASFRLRNAGMRPLQVAIANTSCSCTSAVLDREKLGFHESTGLSVSVKAPERAGMLNVSITLTASDRPGHRVVRLTGKVNQVIYVSPQIANFGVVRTCDLPVSKTVTIHCDTKASWLKGQRLVILPRSTSDSLSCNLAKNGEFDQVLRISLLVGAPRGVVRESIDLEVPVLASSYRIAVPVIYRLID